MIREVIAALMLTIVPAFGLIAWNAVRKTRLAQEALMLEPQLSGDPGGIECMYVSTVLRSEPLKRIWAYGLGSRGEARVSVSGDTVNINRVGERSFAFQLEHVGLESATIDKGVEPKGLVRLDWTSGTVALSTHLRFRSPKRQAEFLQQLNIESEAN